MRTYDQIIFGELADRRPVILEEVGYLKIENVPAKMEGNSVSAPRNIVMYTSEANPEARNVINILESEGIDYQQARDRYYEWLWNARKEGVLAIEEAGELRDGVFTPTGELDKRLNPGRQETVVVKRKRGKAWLWILLVIALLLLLLFGYKRCGSCIFKPEQPIVAVQQPAAPAATDTTARPIPPQAVEHPEKSLNYPLPGRYYVVSGVFDIPENADKLIRQLKVKFPDLAFEKFDYPGSRPGRTMVSVFSSAKYSEALNMQRQLAWNYDLQEYWIYPPMYQ